MNLARLLRSVPSALSTALLLSVVLVLSGVPVVPGLRGASLVPAATAAPPLSVTVSQVSTPRYGDEVTFTVRSTGIDVVATVSYAGTELASQPVDGGTTFSIATLGRFKPGTYRLDVEAASETSSGSARVTFSTTQIPSRIELARTTVDYTAPLTGQVVTARPTAIEVDGRVELVSGGSAIASAPVGPDGSFALSAAMPPCACPHPVEVRLVGATFWTTTGPGTGSFVGALQVNKLATRLEVSRPEGLPTSPLTQGDPFVLGLRVDRVDPATTLVLYGTVTLSAVPASGGPAHVIAERPAERGLPLEIDATDWVAAHEGRWVVTAAYAPTPVHAELVAEASTSFEIAIARARPWPTSTALSLDRSSVAVGQTLTGRIVTRDHASSVVRGARLEVDDKPWPQTLVDGTHLSVTGLGVGTHRLRARFLATPDYQESVSSYLTVTVSGLGPGDPTHPGHQNPNSPGSTPPVASSIRVLRVIKRPHRKVRITFAVASQRGAAPSGTLVLRRTPKAGSKARSTVVGTGRVRAGRVTVTTRRLARGVSRLRATFSGAPGLRTSSSAVVRVRFR